MKHSIFALGTILLATSAHSEVTIVDVTLFNSQNTGQIWITAGTYNWILGVSRNPTGPLLNAPNASVAGISQGNYWLFADPAGLGTLPRLVVNLSDGSVLSALFQVQGTNGTQQSWTRLSGTTELSLGWAQGTIDLVGQYGGVTPNGINDFYMQAILGAVPEPATWLTLCIGMAGLAGTRAFRRRCEQDN